MSKTNISHRYKDDTTAKLKEIERNLEDLARRLKAKELEANVFTPERNSDPVQACLDALVIDDLVREELEKRIELADSFRKMMNDVFPGTHKPLSLVQVARMENEIRKNLLAGGER